MNYSQIIRDAWAATWRYRFLWVLGLFAGGAVGAGGGQSGWRANRDDTGRWSPRLQEYATTTGTWLATHWVPFAIAGGIVVLACVALAFIAQGGMARATGDIAAGRPSSLGQAWRAGLHLGWRYVGLWLAIVGAAVLAAALIGALLALALATGLLTAGAAPAGGPRLALFVALLLALIPLAAVGAAGAVVGSIVLAYAQRAVALADEGPLAALRDGWRLFRGHVGASLLAWLVNVALAIGAGLAAAIALGALFATLGLLGLAFWAALGAQVLTIAYTALAGTLLVVAALTVAGIVNTFFWHYWTLAYLRLQGQASAA